MKIYSFGAETAPVILLLPGTLLPLEEQLWKSYPAAVRYRPCPLRQLRRL